MRLQEFNKIVSAILIFAIATSFYFAINNDWSNVGLSLIFSIIIVLVSVYSKKIMAHLLDADVEHDLWKFQRYGFYTGSKLKNPVPAGLILPIVLSIFSLGIVKLGSILTYETRVLKVRAAKRFGSYSFTEMTDWHNGLIGSAGIIGVILLILIAYFLPVDPKILNLELLAKFASFYAISNIIPFSNLDGSQIFFGSRMLWVILASITTIFFIFGLII